MSKLLGGRGGGGLLEEAMIIPDARPLATFENHDSASNMCAFKGEERSVLISVTLMKGITEYKTVPTIGITFWM